MSNIAELAGLPELTFIEDKTLQNIRDEMISDYIKKLSELGEKAELGTAHPDRLILLSAAQQIYQCMQYIDKGAKMNFLKYAEKGYLDNLAMFKQLERKSASKATVNLQFELSAVQTSVVGIPGGTRVKTDGSAYFVTDYYIEIPAGQLTKTVTATAYESGTAYNSIPIGAIKNIVDPVSYVKSVTNLTESTGGADIESDDELTKRIYEINPSLSVAGPQSAYVYHAKQARADIGDVKVYSPSATNVTVVFLLKNGSLPNSTDLQDMKNYLASAEIRPLTDNVDALAPTEKSYSINLKYFVNQIDSNKLISIQSNVATALAEYQSWQRKIGRDINPSKIYQLLMNAGVKRVEITSPTKIVLSAYEVPKCTSVTCTYGGVEDD